MEANMREIKKIPIYSYETTDGRDDFINEADAIAWQEKLDIVDQIVKLDNTGLPTDSIDETFFVRLKNKQEVEAFTAVSKYEGYCAPPPSEPGDYYYQPEIRNDNYINIKKMMAYCKDIVKKLNANEQEEASDEGN